MKNLGTWGTAIVASLLLHIVVLGLLLGSRGCGSATETPAENPVPQTDGKAVDLPESRNVAHGDAKARPSIAESSRNESASNGGVSESESVGPKKNGVKKTESVGKKIVQKKPETKNAGDEASVGKKTVQKKPETKNAGDEAPDGWKTYKVRAGDSLTKLARQCGIPVHDLAKANGIAVTSSLKLGQTLKVKGLPPEHNQ